MHVGDIFAWKALPYVDASAGGSVVEQPKTLAKAVATVKNVDTIINGHIPVSTWNDLKDYADFTRGLRRLRGGVDEGGKECGAGRRAYTVAPKYKGYVVTIAEGL
jgi:hypothetical protein